LHRTLLPGNVKRLLLLVLTGLFLLSATQCDAQKIFHKKKKVNKSTSVDNNAQPDKVLYDKAMDDIKHGRQEVGRLNMQTLINTYPDSEYLAKAKLAIADSFYKEGGTANMTQAVQGYKDFIVFFPFLPEAAYAQLQVAMAHYRQMEKPDRDRTQAREAEDELQTFIQKYPNDPLLPKAEQHLREVQEVLAEGDYRIGYYYYVKGDKRAAESRLKSVANRYPLYSKADHALWMLGDIWQASEKKEMAAPYYARIVRNYPLSPLVPDAKSRLKALGAPIPQADPQAVAWMTAEQNAPRPHTSMVRKPLGLVHNGPGQELVVASRMGKPNMTPESESDAGTETLNGGSPTRVAGGPVTGIVATVTPGGSSTPTGTAENVPAATEEAAPATATPADPNAPAAATDPTAPAASADAANGATTTGGGDTTAKPDAAPAQDSSPNNSAADNHKESTSKKKKGLRKIIPW
jgi:outer membrane protein assembly factor BamD